jgi:hypothetical protein
MGRSSCFVPVPSTGCSKTARHQALLPLLPGTRYHRKDILSNSGGAPAMEHSICTASGRDLLGGEDAPSNQAVIGFKPRPGLLLDRKDFTNRGDSRVSDNRSTSARQKSWAMMKRE